MIKPSLFQPLQKLSAGILGWRHLAIDSNSTQIPQSKHKVKVSLFNVIHISDTHICDAQSPARVEYLDRFADPHHPAAAMVGSLIGTYRAQESLTVHVLQSMIQTINKIERSPLTDSLIDAVIITGDLTDNAQINELDWCATLLEGGTVNPDSGSPQRWEGAGGERYSPFFWNPHGTPIGESDDFPRALYGYPEIPELLDAIRAPLNSPGLKHEVLAVHGNHDALLQGTVAPDQFLRDLAKSDSKIFQLPDEEALRALGNVTEIGPARYPAPGNPSYFSVTADIKRDFVDASTWSSRFALYNNKDNKKYWRKDYEYITVLALDTVNPFGGWQGSLDKVQMNWLKEQLESLENRLVVITSHHPLQDLFNDYTPHAEPRITRDEIEKLLVSKKQVVAWICGHTHQHRIMYFGDDARKGFWQIETSSLIDWPQQGRTIEMFLNESDEVCIATAPFDHQGIVHQGYKELNVADCDHVAGLSRDLSLNDWQRRNEPFLIELNEGNPSDQAALLVLTDRFKL
jgi:metallophosphoesterase (TIGR03767 family)